MNVIAMPLAKPAINQRAMTLWPDSEYLQREWLRAVDVVRGTAGGWVVEAAAADRERYEQLRAAASSSAR